MHKKYTKIARNKPSEPSQFHGIASAQKPKEGFISKEFPRWPSGIFVLHVLQENQRHASLMKFTMSKSNKNLYINGIKNS